MPTLKIIQDNSPLNPRSDFDNLGTFAGRHHRRYLIGDEKFTAEPTQAMAIALHNEGLISEATFNRYSESFPVDFTESQTQAIHNLFEKHFIYHNVYMYDHSGVVFSITPFECRWDSAKAGIIYVSRRQVREEFNAGRITAKLQSHILQILENEVLTYSQYANGEVYGFQLLDENEEEVDSCWGFFGSNHETNGMLDHIDVPVEELDIIID